MASREERRGEADEVARAFFLSPAAAVGEGVREAVTDEALRGERRVDWRVGEGVREAAEVLRGDRRVRAAGGDGGAAARVGDCVRENLGQPFLIAHVPRLSFFKSPASSNESLPPLQLLLRRPCCHIA